MSMRNPICEKEPLHLSTGVLNNLACNMLVFLWFWEALEASESSWKLVGWNSFTFRWNLTLSYGVMTKEPEKLTVKKQWWFRSERIPFRISCTPCTRAWGGTTIGIFTCSVDVFQLSSMHAFLRPVELYIHCIYVFPSRDPVQNPGQNSGQKT